MHCTQNVTTENHRIMAIKEALVILTLLTLGSSGVYGNDGELSTTTGDTVLIPCDFGEGTVQNLFWYYHNGTGQVKILTFFQGNVSIDAAYTHRASLHNDSSTLILKDIILKDEGTYHCDVDREGQTGVLNINTNLHVFSLTSHNLPEIAQCTEVAGKSSACNVYTNKYITMNCTLRKVYPAEDTELVWYRDEQRVHSTDSSKENDDGTVDITAEIEVSESGNLTCNATFLTAQGLESTVVPVSVWITPVPDAPHAPEKGLSEGDIAGIAVGSVVFVVTCLVVIIIILKRKGHHSPQDAPKNIQNKDQPEETTSFIDGNASNNGGATSPPSLPSPSAKQNDNTDSNTASMTSAIDDETLEALAEQIGIDPKLHKLGLKLGYDLAAITIYKSNNHSGDVITYKGTRKMLADWRNNTPQKEQRSKLRKALEDAGLVLLAEKYLGDGTGVATD